MKKNNGFTLIELLAVIVILAVIALIATPAVLNIIDDARGSSAERSTEALVSATKTYYLTTMAKTGVEPAESDYTLTNIKVDNAPSEVGKISVTATSGVPSVTVKNAKFGDYYCQYSGTTASCSKTKVS